MSVILVWAVLLIWFALVIEINGSILFGIEFTGTTGLLYWTGVILVICTVFLGINAGIKEKHAQEFYKFKGAGKTGKIEN